MWKWLTKSGFGDVSFRSYHAASNSSGCRRSRSEFTAPGHSPLLISWNHRCAHASDCAIVRVVWRRHCRFPLEEHSSRTGPRLAGNVWAHVKPGGRVTHVSDASIHRPLWPCQDARSTSFPKRAMRSGIRLATRWTLKEVFRGHHADLDPIAS